MAWLESHEEIATHPKTKRAARLLNVSVPQLIGHLHLLWWWCLKFAQDGRLSQYDFQDIADAAAWEGDPPQFVQALINCGPGKSCGFLEENEQGELMVHDWMDYAGKLFDRRQANAERMKNARAKHVHSTCRATVPNLTVPNITNDDTDDDNARAREEIKNRALETNQEEPKSPVLAMRVKAVEDDSKPEADAFSLLIALDNKLEEPKNGVQTLGSKAISFAEVNFGRALSPVETCTILDFCQEFENVYSPEPDAIVIAGLKRYINNDQRKMSYLKGIMNDWLSHGVVELSHINLRDKEFAECKKKSANKFKGGNKSAKNIRDTKPRINDSAAYDPSAWAKAGFAVST